MADSNYILIRSGNGTKPVLGSVAKDQKYARKLVKKKSGKLGMSDSENYENYPDDDSVESPGLYKKGMRQLPSDNNPSGDD